MRIWSFGRSPQFLGVAANLKFTCIWKLHKNFILMNLFLKICTIVFSGMQSPKKTLIIAYIQHEWQYMILKHDAYFFSWLTSPHSTPRPWGRTSLHPKKFYIFQNKIPQLVFYENMDLVFHSLLTYKGIYISWNFFSIME